MRLRFQKRAFAQIDTVLSHIAAHSPQGAAQVEARLRAVLQQLQAHPFPGRRIPIAGVRRAFLTRYPYHIDYFVGDEEIVIQRFRHAARKPLSQGVSGEG
ncbi:type II toxin-antitoxin system RelE/ParE family toxin [Rhizobium sp. YIM 134829]|uniref:type II toxin-antitoxin system RelE/ParE family toxin n=1 Tax=Rhizobium sp. YIM 134829 TaxID=3390453 RepID=UPI00397A9196